MYLKPLHYSQETKTSFSLLFDIKRTWFDVIEAFGERTLDLHIRVLVDVVVDDQADKVSHNSFSKVTDVDISLENQLFGSSSSFIFPAF